MSMTPEYRAAIEQLFAANGWNDTRINRSFAGKDGWEVLGLEHNGKLCVQALFRQSRQREYGFEVAVGLRLADSLDHWLAYLYIVGAHLPLHEPLVVPIVYGFTAQLNQLHTAASGLEHVYRVAGVAGLRYYPAGKLGFW